MKRKNLLRLKNDKMRFKLIKSIYNGPIVLKTIEEGGNIYVVEKKETAKWMNVLEFGLVTTVVTNRVLKFFKNYEKYFRGAKVIILYPKKEREFAEKIEKKLGEYTCNIMVALIDDVEL
ncbi:hypothetical protein CLPUN_44370 [Clostridium puniceum]|uniref:Uncharacterized protein n=1 Tax=Clostridium puniceum TaxID=29367 RepID=A0A1S8T7G3_9CLOT|nr:hypothetical protein [Clostridium puniceum]OOM73683.1 hypothetical protein CLPUN_44370 [Clostridium puniceum]